MQTKTKQKRNKNVPIQYMPTAGEVYDQKAGFQKVILERVKAKHPESAKAFKIQDVSKWFLENLNSQKNQKGYNSYVAPEPLHEIEIDLMEHNYEQPPKQKVTEKEFMGLPGHRVNRAELRKTTSCPPTG